MSAAVDFDYERLGAEIAKRAGLSLHDGWWSSHEIKAWFSLRTSQDFSRMVNQAGFPDAHYFSLNNGRKARRWPGKQVKAWGQKNAKIG